VDQVAVLLTGAKTITAKAYRLLEGIVETAVDLDTLRVRVRLAELERMNGRRVPGDTKSEAGTRTVILPAFLCRELRWHLESRAEAGPEGLLFVGEKGAPFRRSAFGRKWRRAREIVGMPEDFRSYGLRHTGHALSTRSGATLKDTMVRAGQSSEKAALIYQHSDDERQEEVAAGLDATVRKARAATTEKAPDKRSGTRQLITTDSKKARVSDLGLCHGAGDENRTRTLSLGS
jgi:integrase